MPRRSPRPLVMGNGNRSSGQFGLLLFGLWRQACGSSGLIITNFCWLRWCTAKQTQMKTATPVMNCTIRGLLEPRDINDSDEAGLTIRKSTTAMKFHANPSIHIYYIYLHKDASPKTATRLRSQRAGHFGLTKTYCIWSLGWRSRLGSWCSRRGQMSSVRCCDAMATTNPLCPCLFGLRTNDDELECFITCRVARRAKWLSANVVEGNWRPALAPKSNVQRRTLLS